jgi:indolepyruvate ferredoxin oxidoreductase
MAIKDEYEVARLHVHSGFLEKLGSSSKATTVLVFNLAPPLLGRRDGHRRAAQDELRRLDAAAVPGAGPAAHAARHGAGRVRPHAERRMERQLIGDYRAMVEDLLARFDRVDYDTALSLARLPEQIRGFGHVKEESVVSVRVRWAALVKQLDTAGPSAPKASPRQAAMAA